jgi:hypothetical protein
VIRVSVVVPCTSVADELAFASLGDAVRAIADRSAARIVGGHMVGLLLTAFPVDGLAARRTVDADAGVSTEIAARGDVVDRLLADGYRATAGNRFERDGRTIDLLVESLDGRFRPRHLGGRHFDASPGLDVVLAQDPIEVDTTVVDTHGREERFVVRVPTVEMATILKTYAWASRRSTKDLADLGHLLEIRHAHGADAVGGWALDTEPVSGRRLDTARTLRSIRPADARFADSGIAGPRFVALIREYVAVV